MSFKFKIIYFLLSLRWYKFFYRKDLKRLQKLRWNNFQKVLLKSPFYAKNAKLVLGLKDYPIMSKKSFMQNFNKINTHNIDLTNAFDIAVEAEVSRDFSPMIENVTVGLSSGTSGNRGVFLATEKERAQWVASVLDRVIGFSIRKRTIAFFLRANSNLYDSVKSNVLQFEFFDLFDELSVHVSRLNALQPNLLIAQPSLLIELAKEIKTGRLRILPQKIISVAEVLYPEDKLILEEAFQQKIHQVYQCTEGFLASSCEEGTLHFNEDFLIIEKKYLDDQQERFHPIITDLLRSSQPVVRYELNDIIHEEKNCPCGLKTLAIKKIEGRSDDVLIFESNNKEIKIFPDFFRRAIIMSDEAIIDYVLIQKRIDKIELYILGEIDSFDKAKCSVINLLNKYYINNVEIVRILTNKHEKGNKLRRIRNERIKTN